MAGFTAYVPNFSSDTVSVVSLFTNTVIATIPLPAGSMPYGSVVSSFLNANRAYITNSGTNTVSVIDTILNAVIATIPVGNTPRPIAINEAGTFVYVGNFGDNSISVIDTATNTVVATLNGISTPSGLVTNSSVPNTFLYVTNFGTNTVTVLNITTILPTVVTTVGVGINPIGIDIDFPFKGPDTTRFLYVANFGSNTVSVIDTATNTLFTTLSNNIGNQPFGVGLLFNFGAQQNEIVLVTNSGSSTISSIEPLSGNIFGINTFPVSGTPFGISTNPFAPVDPYALSSTDLIGLTGGGSEGVIIPVGDNPISLGHFAGAVPAISPVIADLALEFKTVDNPTPIIGSNVTFQISGINLSVFNVEGVIVNDPLPIGFTYVSSTTTNGMYDPLTGIWNIGHLNPLQPILLEIVATVNTALPSINTATISFPPPQVDPNPANNTVSVTITPVAPTPQTPRRRKKKGASMAPVMCVNKFDKQGNSVSCPNEMFYGGYRYKKISDDENTCCYQIIR